MADYNTSYRLLSAVREGNLEKAKELINCFGLSYSQAWSEGYVLLRDAIKKKHTAVIKLLLTNGSKVNNKNKKPSNTPLHFAVINGDIEIVKMLLDRGANINAKNQYGTTSLHNAIKRKNMEIIELLLNHGANVNAANNNGITPLHIAAKKRKYYTLYYVDVMKYIANINNDIKIVMMLLNKGANIDAKDDYGRTPLHNAIKNEKMEITELLLNRGAIVNIRNNDGITPLHIAAKKGNLQIVECLLKHGSSANISTFREGYTPLHFAGVKNHEKIVKLLLEWRAKIDAQDNDSKTIMHFAVKKRHLVMIENSDSNVKETIKLLLSRANVNAQTKNGIKTLHIATKKGYVKVVETLLEHNADVNCKDNRNITPLHFSAQKGNEIISKMLLNKGANVNAKEKNGITALHSATQNGHEEIVKVLLKCGAKVNSKSKSNITPLHIAAQKGYLEIVKILLKFGADINSRDKYGKTALHIASKERHKQTIIALLEHGSDINIIDKNNNTPLDIVMAVQDDISSFYELDEVCSDHSEDDSEDDYCGICACEQVAKILRQHIVKMKTANLYVNEKNLLRTMSNYEIRDFQDECKKEVAIMKSEKISDTNISFYNILTKSTNQLTIYMRNENIVQVLNSNDYTTKFPIYASMIESNFRKGIKKKELLEQGNTIFYFLFNNFPELPYNCIEKIFSYLNDKDLRILIDACKSASVSSLNKY